MREKKRMLIILLVVCILLSALAFLLLRPQDTEYEELFDESAAKHDHELDPSFIENTSGELLIDKEPSDVKTLVLTNENGTFTMKRDSVTASLYIEEIDRDIPLCEDFLEYVWYYAYCLGYNYKIVSTSDMPIVLSDFGLDSPSATFSITYSDGSEVSFQLGNSLVTSDNVYYITFDGHDNAVFITEMSLAAFQGEGYFIDTDFFGISSDESDVDIGTIKISGSSIPDKIVIEPYAGDDQSDQSYGHSRIITAPIRTPVNDVNTTAIVNELIYLAADSAIISNPSKKTIAEYGLDDPTLVINFYRNGEEKVIYIGKTDRSTYCYAMLKGLDVIYNIDPANAEAILSSSLSFLRSNELRKYRIHTVESVSVSFIDESYTFDVKRTALSDDGYYEYHAYFGENELTLDYYRDFLAVISGAYASSWDTKTLSDTPALTIKVKHFDSFDRKDDILEFYEADYGRFICSINGKKTASVPAIFLTKVMSASRSLSLNQPVA